MSHFEMVQSIALHHLFVFGEWELPSGQTRRGTQAPPYRDLAPQDTRGIP